MPKNEDTAKELKSSKALDRASIAFFTAVLTQPFQERWANAPYGNIRNYLYAYNYSLLGLNVAQWVGGEAKFHTSSIAVQAALSGTVTGLLQALWTTPSITRELAKTTGAKAPAFPEYYLRVFPALAIRDSIRWTLIQAGALYMQEAEKNYPIPFAAKAAGFLAIGATAAAVSAPSEQNLVRAYPDRSNRCSMLIFCDSSRKQGLIPTLTANFKLRFFSILPSMVVYSAAQYLQNTQLDSEENFRPHK